MVGETGVRAGGGEAGPGLESGGLQPNGRLQTAAPSLCSWAGCLVERLGPQPGLARRWDRR